MSGIDPEIMVHCLNDDKRVTERVQPIRAFSEERYQAICEEVDKLLAANFIREAEHPKWVSNIVMADLYRLQSPQQGLLKRQLSSP